LDPNSAINPIRTLEHGLDRGMFALALHSGSIQQTRRLKVKYRETMADAAIV
jgi:hypothetical protein